MAVKAKQAPKKPLKSKVKEPEPEEELEEEAAEDDEDEDVEEDAEEDEDEEVEERQTAKGGDGKKKAKAPKKAKDPLVRLVADPEPKFGGPQVQGILKCLQENDNEMKLSDLVKALPDFIKTQQPVERIFAFYRRQLVNAGAIEVV